MHVCSKAHEAIPWTKDASLQAWGIRQSMYCVWLVWITNRSGTTEYSDMNIKVICNRNNIKRNLKPNIIRYYGSQLSDICHPSFISPSQCPLKIYFIYLFVNYNMKNCNYLFLLITGPFFWRYNNISWDSFIVRIVNLFYWQKQ